MGKVFVRRALSSRQRAATTMIGHIIREDLSGLCSEFDSEPFSGKSILISGGAGFIGAWLTDALLCLGANVTALDNLSTGQIKNIDHLQNNRRFRFIQGDVVSFDTDAKYDCVLHLASRASPEEYQQHPVETLLANSLGSQRMLELARQGDSCILYSSSSEVYGDAQVLPTPEDYWGNVNPLGPRSCYSEGKRFGEALFLAYEKEYRLDTRIGRIFNTYGPRIRSDGSYARVIPRFISQALAGRSITVYGNGSQTRSFCYVTDVVCGLLRLLTSSNARGEVINIGADRELPILELASQIRTLTSTSSPVVFSKTPLRAEDSRRRCPDLSKAARLLGWAPKVSLKDGVERTIRWVRIVHGKSL